MVVGIPPREASDRLVIYQVLFIVPSFYLFVGN